MFADTDIAALLTSLYGAGADKRRTLVRLIRGAQICDGKGLFNIGKRNYVACRKQLWAAGLLIQAEEIGGAVSRTVRLDVASGKLWWRGPSDPEQELISFKGVKVCRTGF